MKMVKIRIPDEDYKYIYEMARLVIIDFNDVLGKAIAIGLYALRRDDGKGLYIHDGKKFVKLDLGKIDLKEEKKDETGG